MVVCRCFESCSKCPKQYQVSEQSLSFTTLPSTKQSVVKACRRVWNLLIQAHSLCVCSTVRSILFLKAALADTLKRPVDEANMLEKKVKLNSFEMEKENNKMGYTIQRMLSLVTNNLCIYKQTHKADHFVYTTFAEQECQYHPVDVTHGPCAWGECIVCILTTDMCCKCGSAASHLASCSQSSPQKRVRSCWRSVWRESLWNASGTSSKCSTKTCFPCWSFTTVLFCVLALFIIVLKSKTQLFCEDLYSNF